MRKPLPKVKTLRQLSEREWEDWYIQYLKPMEDAVIPNYIHNYNQTRH
jgi:hypothetical protein